MSTVFSEFTEETAFMLGHNIVYIANWCFGLDYTSIATNTLQKVEYYVISKF